MIGLLVGARKAGGGLVIYDRPGTMTNVEHAPQRVPPARSPSRLPHRTTTTMSDPTTNGTPADSLLPRDPDDFFVETRMSFGDHIEELRRYLWKAIAGLGF